MAPLAPHLEAEGFVIQVPITFGNEISTWNLPIHLPESSKVPGQMKQ